MTIKSAPNAMGGERFSIEAGLLSGYARLPDGWTYHSLLTRGRRVYVADEETARMMARRDAGLDTE